MFYKRKIIFIALLLSWFTSFFPQSPKVPVLIKLDHLISFLEKKYGITFSFDADLIKDVPVMADTSLSSLQMILNAMNTNSAFTFHNAGNNNILVKPVAPTGNFVLCGTVTDKKTKEPLPGTLVYHTAGKFYTSTDEGGSFHKIIRYNENDSVIISTTGYHKIILPVSAFNPGTCSEIILQNTFCEIKEVSVTAYIVQGISYDAADNSIMIRPKNLSILPGQTNGDLLQSLDALPGVNSPDTKAGNINIRGSSPDQTLIMFDNIPLYHKGHYFGTISPISPRAVDNIKIQRSTAGANSGGRAGGVIEIASANAVINKMQGSATASLLDASFYMHAPIIKNRLSFLFSVRHSYPYSWNSPALHSLSNYVFQATAIQPLLDSLPGHHLNSLTFYYRDANAKLIANLSEKHKATVSFLYIDNRMAVSSVLNNGPPQFDTAALTNWGLNATVSSKWNSRFFSQVSVTNSFYRQNFNNKQLFTTQPVAFSYFNNYAADFRILAETDWRINDKYALKSGYDLRHHDMGADKDANDTIASSNSLHFASKGFIHSAYTSILASPIKKLLLNAGVRVNLFSVNNSISVEPRLSMSYKLDSVFRLKASAGYQKQFVTQVSGVGVESIGGIENPLWLLAGSKGIPVINSSQATFGGMFEKNMWLIDIEGYYRIISNVSFINTKHPDAPQPFINGSINVVGADFLVRRQWKQVDAWLSYTLSKSLMHFDSVQSSPFISLFDQTHVLDLACSYKVKRWKFSAAWKYRTGLAALPGIRVKMLAGASSAPSPVPAGPPPPPAGPVPGEFRGRFPDYHQLDISAVYSFPKKKKRWYGTAGFSGLNVYNRKNIIGQAPENKGGKMIMHNKYGLKFMPNVTLTISW